MTASITSWRQKVRAITATWSCCHGCHFITVSWNCLIFGGILQKWLILMVIIIVSLYFVKGKSYKHSLVIYWTALVSKVLYNMFQYVVIIGKARKLDTKKAAQSAENSSSWLRIRKNASSWKTSTNGYCLGNPIAHQFELVLGLKGRNKQCQVVPSW